MPAPTSCDAAALPASPDGTLQQVHEGGTLVTSLDQALPSSEGHPGEFKLTQLPIPPARKLAVIDCRDAPWTVETMRGLNTGDAHILRHADEVSSEDALRSLLISRNRPGTRSS